VKKLKKRAISSVLHEVTIAMCSIALPTFSFPAPEGQARHAIMQFHSSTIVIKAMISTHQLRILLSSLKHTHFETLLDSSSARCLKSRDRQWSELIQIRNGEQDNVT
jgi:hypothetical protein